MRKNACCFTGHREIPSEDREPLRAALLSEIQRLYAEKGVTEFYTGGARGFDTMAAEAVLKIREALPVRLHLILPCKGQSDRWHFAEKRRYREILKQADTAEFLFERYTPDCMLRRDDAMVARSGYCVCYLRDPAAKRGGTAYTVRRAKKEGLEVIHLIPVEVEQFTLL